MTELLYMENVLCPESHQRALSWVHDLPYVGGQSQKGKAIDRQQLWFQKDGEYFNPLWTSRYPRWVGHTYPPILTELQQVICEHVPGFNPNSCLINLYADGTAFIPKHKDNSLCFGDRPIIAGLSIGATRTFRINGKDYELKDNSLFVMSGDSVIHELLPDADCVLPRYSLTFREWMDPSKPMS